LALSIFPLTCIPPCPNSVAYSKKQMIMWVWLSIHVHVFALFIMLVPCHLWQHALPLVCTDQAIPPEMQQETDVRPQHTYA
jgi:hypothetical protein